MANAYTYTTPGITGTSTTAKVMKKSAIKKAAKNDICLNPTTGHVYRCEKAGDPKTATWKYLRTDLVGNPDIGYSNLGAPSRGSGNRKLTASWKVPKKIADAKNGRRATDIEVTWKLGCTGGSIKEVVTKKNESSTSDTINLDNFEVGSKTYTRNSFYPINSDRKLKYVTVNVVPTNKFGKGSVEAKSTREFSAPRKPSLSSFSFNKDNGELSCTISTNAGADYQERYDTKYEMYIKKSWESKETLYSQGTGTTTETSKTVKYDATGYQYLEYGQYIRVRVKAWARGYAGDSEKVEKRYYIAYPAQASIEDVKFSGYTGTDLCRVKVNTNQKKDKSGQIYNPVDKVTLEYLANVDYATASAIPAEAVWEDSGNLDDGQCTALAMPVARLICEPGKWSYLRVVTYHANEDVLFRYSEYRQLTSLHKDAPTAADDEIVVVSALPNPDGVSADVTLAWDAVGGSSDDATGTELSWDTDRNAWRSTKEPSTHEFTWYDSGSITHEGVTYRKHATITIKGLSEGETYYVRARRYLEGDVTTYGEYSPDVDPVVMTKSATSIVATCNPYVSVGDSLPITWTLSGGGLQKEWSVVSSNGTPIASGSGTFGYTQIDASRLMTFATNNVVTFTVQASIGADVIVSEPLTVRIVEKPTLEITGTSMVHVHEEDTQTYSGDIVEIDNSRDVLTTKSLLVTLDPIQDLNGYDKPWSGGAGKNKIPFPYTSPSGSISGITVSYGTEGEIKASGTASASNNIFLIQSGFALKAGTYTVSVNGNHIGAMIYVRDRDTSTMLASINGGSASATATFTLASDMTNGMVYINWNGTPTIDFDCTIQIEQGSTATSYEPYSNICPISGRTDVVTHRTGVNVWDEEWEVGGLNGSTGALWNTTDRIRSKNFIDVEPSASYYIHYPSSGVAMNYCFYDADKAFISSDNVVNSAITTPANARYMKFATYAQYGTTYNNDISINYPSTDHDYHAYEGDTYTTTLGQTVYGGVLDVVSGELVVDRAMVDMGNLSWSRYSPSGTNIPAFYAVVSGMLKANEGASLPICSSYKCESWTDLNRREDGTLQPHPTLAMVYVADSRFEDASAFTSAVSGQTFVYELAQPQTIQLTPQEVELLLGQNNVWSDGDIELTTAEVLVDGDFLRTNDLSIDVEASTVCDLSIVVSSQGAVGQTPTGMKRQTAGDTVYSILDRAVAWEESSGMQIATLNLPTGLDFWDLGTYTVSITAIDRTSGLKSDEVTEEVKVYWARRAPDPADYVTITAVDEVDDTGYHIKGADIALTPPENSADTDVYDIYRYTGDGAELIGESFPLTHTARDVYAPFSEDGTQHYRIAIRTVDGDTEFADIEYIAEGEFLRFDWAEGYLELPYGVTMGDSYSKDVEFRKHMDGGTDGYWNPNIERKGSYSSAVIKLIQPSEIEMARRLARFAGAVYVRTPEGTAYLADVQVTDLSRKNEAVMLVAFDATEVDLTQEYMLPTPFEREE